MKRHFIIFLSTWLVIAFSYILHADKSPHKKKWKDLSIEGSLLNWGNIARIQHVMDKARKGQNVVIGVIGGSITEGMAAGKEEDRWANRLHKWWKETFPGANIKFINAGMSGTGSLYGAHRINRDLLIYHPDFVVVEFAVNDSNTKLSAETLEGLVRQILKQPNKPAILLLFTAYRNGDSAQQWHSEVGKHYELPMISYKNAIHRGIESGRFTWEDISSDTVHPNNRGHKYCAGLLTTYLKSIFDDMPKDEDLPSVPQVPGPMISDVFEYTAIYQNNDITPIENNGWNKVRSGWQAAKPGSKIVFNVSGSLISILFLHAQGDRGIAEVIVDDNMPLRLDGRNHNPWSHWMAEIIATDLKYGQHQVRINIIKGNSEGSNGHLFDILAIMTAGCSASVRCPSE